MFEINLNSGNEYMPIKLIVNITPIQNTKTLAILILYKLFVRTNVTIKLSAGMMMNEKLADNIKSINTMIDSSKFDPTQVKIIFLLKNTILIIGNTINGIVKRITFRTKVLKLSTSIIPIKRLNLA